jgi:hypothetical protein
VLANPLTQPLINQKKAFEIQAKVAGLTEDEIKQLLDTSEYGNAEIISEAALDLEGLLDGKPVKPNKAANLAYKQYVVDFLTDHEDDMTHQQYMKIAAYVKSLEPIIMKNTVRELNQKMTAMMANTPPSAPGAPKPTLPANNGLPGPGLSPNPVPTPNGPAPIPALGA